MTKKRKIFNCALKLFSEFGYHSVSTAKIARAAGVSEGLVFKHFKSKAELLKAIYSEVDERLKVIYQNVLEEENPQKVPLRFINIVTKIEKKDYPFWRLIFKLKWNENFYQPEKMQPIIDKLTWAFKKMKIKRADTEAQLLVHIIENISISILRDGMAKNQKLIDHIKTKYSKILTNEI